MVGNSKILGKFGLSGNDFIFENKRDTFVEGDQLGLEDSSLSRIRAARELISSWVRGVVGFTSFVVILNSL